MLSVCLCITTAAICISIRPGTAKSPANSVVRLPIVFPGGVDGSAGWLDGRMVGCLYGWIENCCFSPIIFPCGFLSFHFNCVWLWSFLVTLSLFLWFVCLSVRMFQLLSFKVFSLWPFWCILGFASNAWNCCSILRRFF